MFYDQIYSKQVQNNSKLRRIYLTQRCDSSVDLWVMAIKIWLQTSKRPKIGYPPPDVA